MSAEREMMEHMAIQLDILQFSFKDHQDAATANKYYIAAVREKIRKTVKELYDRAETA